MLKKAKNFCTFIKTYPKFQFRDMALYVKKQNIQLFINTLNL